MTYTLNCEKRDGLLYITVSGEILSADDYAAKARAVVAKALETKLYRVLLDERNIVVSIDTYDIMRIVDWFDENNIQMFGGRLACLCNEESVDVYKKFETVYKNRSFSYRLFLDKTDAVAWLTS